MIEMNSGESTISPVGNATLSLILVVGTSCPNLIFGLAINSVLLVRLYQNWSCRHQVVFSLLTFVTIADVFNAIFGPVLILLHTFDKKDVFNYFHLVECMSVLFKVWSSSFQSAVQLSRILQYLSPVLATKCFNMDSLIFMVPGLLGFAGIVALLPYIAAGKNIYEFEDHQLIHNSVWFRIIHTVSMSGFIFIFSVILLLILFQRFVKRQCAVGLRQTVAQDVNTVSPNTCTRKKRNSDCIEMLDMSVGNEPIASHRIEKCFETNLSKSAPNLRNLKGSKNVQPLHIDMEPYHILPDAQQSITNKKEQSLSTEMNPYTTESTFHDNQNESSKNEWLPESTLKSVMKRSSVTIRTPVKRLSQIIRNASLNLPSNNTFSDKRNDAEVKRTKSQTMLVSSSQERNCDVQTKPSTSDNKTVHQNSRPKRQHRPRAKHMSLSFGDKRQTPTTLPPAISVTTIYIRKIISTILFVSAIFLGGLHHISYSFEARDLSRMEFVSILFSNFMCVITPVYNILVCESFQILRHTKVN